MAIHQRQERDPLPLIGLAAVFGAAMLAGRFARGSGTRADRVVRRRALDAASPSVRVAATVASPPAFPLVYMPASLLAARLLAKGGNAAGERVPIAAGLAFVAYHALKRASHRRRPPSKRGRGHYNHAYPSGHATASSAVAVATALAMRHNRRRPSPATLAMVGIGAPLVVGVSRVLLDEHWLTDVVGGWLLGAGIAGMTHRRPRVQRWVSSQKPPVNPIVATA
jgi:membrane-associated phospholipid phosphatase